jgi:hypothetical protein
MPTHSQPLVPVSHLYALHYGKIAIISYAYRRAKANFNASFAELRYATMEQHATIAAIDEIFCWHLTR